MYIAGTESCQISVDEPSALVVALYIRELIGISGLTAPEIPVLDPSSDIWPAWAPRPSAGLAPPPDPFAGLIDREQTAREWARWWRHALAVGAAAIDDLHPPKFPAFHATPSLRLLLQVHYERAALWADVISSDPRVKRAHSAPRDGLETLAREAARSWGARPFRLRITVIPVQTEHAWQLGPDHILMTRHLIADRENVLDWLRSRILAMS
ncbi:hypothetical protein SAMN04515671_2470 [Nakamurella panacisegetis]|uniref:Uncharacterized protein n=1 Tax=Nakamurella panacisegetis TaxID=1090615 RepID=A0A1H0NSL6_9ACTN|nr:hypothetical protein [Nakamurella panacisegetis]SDO95634.1 hypothetical protein SAMN04515671_2470 [Nakamurella panacisegetis]